MSKSKYIVVNENTLGYRIRETNAGETFGILASTWPRLSVGPAAPRDPKVGWSFLSSSDIVRPATPEDLAAFRVHPGGYDLCAVI